MIAVLSPAKTLDLTTPPPFPATPARFADEAATLAKAASHLTQKRLSELMKISPALAKLNADRFRDFDDAEERPALYTFDGDVYTGLDAASLDEPAVRFAQHHLRLLSGLYGLLRPLDGMRPYRLEMGTRWAPRHRKLTDWWGTRIADALAHDVAAEGTGTVLNLASQEYFGAVDAKALKLPVVTPQFREQKNGESRIISFFAKKARGAMARFAIDERVERVEDLKAFDRDDYRFDKAASTDNEWIFIRSGNS